MHTSNSIEAQSRGIIQEATKAFSAIFAHDLDLVRESAKHHGVGISQGGILLPPKFGVYSLRLPTGRNDEVNALLTAQSIVVGCIDYRQAFGIYDAVKPDAVITIAGGAGQPEPRRQNALVDFLVTLSQVNPAVSLWLLVHNRICGGLNHATDGEIARTFENGGYAAERMKLVEYLTTTESNLIARSVPRNRFTLGIARIGEGNDYLGIDTHIES